jgi:hypothetical protein
MIFSQITAMLSAQAEFWIKQDMYKRVQGRMNYLKKCACQESQNNVIKDKNFNWYLKNLYVRCWLIM